jgi:HSP20 family protein
VNVGCDPFTAEFDSMVERFFGQPLALERTGSEQRAWSMPVDITETNDAYHVEVELPGIDQKNVEVTLSEGVLTIQAEKQEVSRSDNDNRHVTERRYGSFRRSFVLPNSVDDSKVDARFEKGVLHVDLIKTAPVKARKIEIKAS